MVDQNLKTTTLDDFVKDLIAQNTTERPGTSYRASSLPQSPLPQSRPPQSIDSLLPKVAPSQPISSYPFLKTPSSNPPLPQFTPLAPVRQEPPKSGGLVLPNLPSSGKKPSSLEDSEIKEYQSTLRTMADDLKRIKSGQELSSVEIQKRIIPVKPSSNPTQSQGKDIEQMAAKVPSSFGIGELGSAVEKIEITRKEAPARPLPEFKPYQTETPPLSQEPKTKIVEKIVVVEKRAEKPVLAFKTNSASFNYKKILFYVGIAVGGLAAVYVYFTYFDQTELEPTPATSPTPVKTSATPRPTATPKKSISEIFTNTSAISIELSATGNPSDLLYGSINSMTITKKEFKKLNILETESGRQHTIISLLDRFLITYPSKLKELLKTDNSLILLYGQEELSDQDGRRLVIVAETTAISGLEVLLSSWEPSLIENISTLFGLDQTQVSSTTFLANTYKGVKIRYKNLNLPNKTED